jgi:hypothetical protein
MTILAQNWLTLSQVASRFPGSRGAARKHPSSYVRYITRGCRGVSGQRIKLAAIRDGNRWLVSEESLAKFIAACSETGPVQSYQPQSMRDRAAEAAEHELEKMGAFKKK